MKKPLAAVLVAVLLVGCGIIPKKVEFLQKDVPDFPSKTPKQVQVERQTAALLADKTRETEKAAIAEDCTPNVTKPAFEASQLAGALSLSLGPPERPWQGTVDALATRLEALEAKRDIKLDRLEGKLDKLEGKPVEGTGKVQMPWIVYVAGVVLGIFVLIELIRLAVNVSAAASPEAAAAKAGFGLAWKGAAQLVKGGGTFLTNLRESSLSQDAQAEVKRLFIVSHKTAQDEDVKKLVNNLPGAASL